MAWGAWRVASATLRVRRDTCIRQVERDAWRALWRRNDAEYTGSLVDWCTCAGTHRLTGSMPQRHNDVRAQLHCAAVWRAQFGYVTWLEISYPSVKWVTDPTENEKLNNFFVISWQKYDETYSFWQRWNMTTQERVIGALGHSNVSTIKLCTIS